MLTDKQEKFAQAIALDGMNAADAYRAAYNTENMKSESIWCNASKLKSDAKVAQRIEELQATLINPKIMSAQKRLEWLTDVITSTAESTNDKLKAADIMNKMQGEYVQKVQAEVQSAVTINIDLVDDDE